MLGNATGNIFVFATDSSSSNTPPPSAIAVLDGGAERIEFGSSDSVIFSAISAGSHTVTVTNVEHGYLLRQSPNDPEATSDPESIYGNPQHVYVMDNQTEFSGFTFDPVITASAEVRDGWTMERLEDVAIEFIFEGSSGSIAKTKYPSHADYAINWTTDTEGHFPTDTILYVHDYDLRLNKQDYQPYYSSNVIINASPGDHFDLGTLFLYPDDTNTNQVSDAWETLYFGAIGDMTTDADNDGMCNRDEYIAGTDPTNWYSCLWLFQTAETNGHILLQWETEPDRTYRISGTTNLCADTWVQVAGAWEATNGQYQMAWIETNDHLSWCNSYRIDIMPCGWTGTNSILVRTNDWPNGGSSSSTNNWPGGLPPLPGQ
jgi:hypothetical protein